MDMDNQNDNSIKKVITDLPLISSTSFLQARIIFLQEMIDEKTKLFISSLESLKRLEGRSAGSKDLVEKISNYIKGQQADTDLLVVQQKMSQEICNFVKIVLDGVKSFAVLSGGDIDRIYFSKQGELLFIQQDVERLNQQKLDFQQQIEKLELEKKPVEIVLLGEDFEKSTKKKKIRPDQDPTTKAGRAAIDLAERRKKFKKTNS